MEEETLRGRKHHQQDERTLIKQNGGDELPAAQRAGHAPTDEKDSKEKLGVNEEHKTKAMRDKHRGSFP